MTFRSRESNAHYYAKETFKDWLEKTWQYNREHGYKNVLSHLSWTDPDVYLEYPILSKELADGREDLLGLRAVWSSYPTEEQMERAGLTVRCTVDLVVCSDGVPKYGIEIVHKHLCTESKREFLRGLKGYGIDFKVYEVSAQWVLDQMHGYVPKILDMYPVN